MTLCRRGSKHGCGSEALCPRETECPRISPPQLPLDFETNRGQAAADYGFVAHGPTYALGLSATDIALSLHRLHEDSQTKPQSAEGPGAMKPIDHAQIDLRLVGANKNASTTGGAEVWG